MGMDIFPESWGVFSKWVVARLKSTKCLLNVWAIRVLILLFLSCTFLKGYKLNSSSFPVIDSLCLYYHKTYSPICRWSLNKGLKFFMRTSRIMYGLNFIWIIYFLRNFLVKSWLFVALRVYTPLAYEKTKYYHATRIKCCKMITASFSVTWKH